MMDTGDIKKTLQTMEKLEEITGGEASVDEGQIRVQWEESIIRAKDTSQGEVKCGG